MFSIQQYGVSTLLTVVVLVGSQIFPTGFIGVKAWEEDGRWTLETNNRDVFGLLDESYLPHRLEWSENVGRVTFETTGEKPTVMLVAENVINIIYIVTLSAGQDTWIADWRIEGTGGLIQCLTLFGIESWFAYGEGKIVSPTGGVELLGIDGVWRLNDGQLNDQGGWYREGPAPVVTATASRTSTPTATMTLTPSPSPTTTVTETATSTPTATRTATKTASPSVTASKTATGTVTPTATGTATPVARRIVLPLVMRG